MFVLEYDYDHAVAIFLTRKLYQSRNRQQKGVLDAINNGPVTIKVVHTENEIQSDHCFSQGKSGSLGYVRK